MKILLLVLLLVPVAATGQTPSTQTIRWGSASLEKNCCYDYMVDGGLVTVYRDAKLTFVVSIRTDVDDKYHLVVIDFLNKDEVPITVDPNNFQLSLKAPVNRTYPSLHYLDVAKEMEKRGKGGRWFRGFRARMSQLPATVDTTTTGRVIINDSSGQSATGTYRGESTSTISTPDYDAIRRAREKNAAEEAENKQKADHFAHHALKANTIFKDQMVGGVVFFKKDKMSPGAVLSFRIGNVTYEIPYGTERAK